MKETYIYRYTQFEQLVYRHRLELADERLPNPSVHYMEPSQKLTRRLNCHPF